MCGFICVYDKRGKIKGYKPEIARAGKKLIHRGPDDSGSYYDDFIGISFYRLSIIDTSEAGHQPMFSSNRRFIIAYNGEIYNYKELRIDLERRGYVFLTNSDTEVLLKSYEEYGENCINYIRGMFAFLIWDRINKILAVFRDRLGIKPLYIYRDKQIVIASEIKAILEYDRKAKAPDERTIFKYMARGWIDDSPDTFYKDIKAVPVATKINIGDNNFVQEKYWTLKIGEGRHFESSEFRQEFTETVSLHLRSDVPLATTLSGGLDSSSIVSIAARLKGPDRLKAFSVIPPDTADESFWINKTVEKFKIEHSYIKINFYHIVKIIDEVIKVHDEPFHSISCIYQYLLRQEVVKRSIKVLLVGEGGDEVLGGYRRFFYPYLYSLLKDKRKHLYLNALNRAKYFMGLSQDSILKNLKNYSELLESGGSGQENLSVFAILNDDFIKKYSKIVQETAYPKNSGQYKNYFFAHLAQHLFIRDIPYVLRMEDRNSMAHGIESRVPYIDHKFIELVFSYDYAEFMRNGLNKAMLRRAMSGHLPKQVLSRKEKNARPGSDAHIIYNILKEEMEDILITREFRNSGYWKTGCLELFKKDCSLFNRERARAWFRLYILLRWSNLFS